MMIFKAYDGCLFEILDVSTSTWREYVQEAIILITQEYEKTHPPCVRRYNIRKLPSSPIIALNSILLQFETPKQSAPLLIERARFDAPFMRVSIPPRAIIAPQKS